MTGQYPCHTARVFSVRPVGQFNPAGRPAAVPHKNLHLHFPTYPYHYR